MKLSHSCFMSGSAQLGFNDVYIDTGAEKRKVLDWELGHIDHPLTLFKYYLVKENSGFEIANNSSGHLVCVAEKCGAFHRQFSG